MPKPLAPPAYDARTVLRERLQRRQAPTARDVINQLKVLRRDRVVSANYDLRHPETIKPC